MASQQYYGQTGCSNQGKKEKQKQSKGQTRKPEGPTGFVQGTGKFTKVPNFNENRMEYTDGVEMGHEQKMLDIARRMRNEEAKHIQEEEAHIRREKEYQTEFDHEYQEAESQYRKYQNKKH